MANFTETAAIDNPLFFDNSSIMWTQDEALHQRIQDLERQVVHHKQNSLELQRAILDQTQVKRRYNYRDTTRDKHTQVSHVMNSKELVEKYANDLVAGIGLSSQVSLPKSLIRAYVAFRLQNADNIPAKNQKTE